MVADKPGIDPIEAYSPETGECVLSEPYKSGIMACLPRGAKATEAFWCELADMVSTFLIMEKCHAARRSPAPEIRRWQRIAKLATEVIQNHASAHIKILVEGQLKAYRAFQGDFSRKKNRNNEVLYKSILEDLWCTSLGQELGVSVNNNVPGPLIKFFSACVNPLLTKPLTTTGIVAIRDRVRERREKIAITSKVRTRKRIKNK